MKRRQNQPDLFAAKGKDAIHPRMVSSKDVYWTGPGTTPHDYAPDIQAMGDCDVCGHTYQSHLKP